MVELRTQSDQPLPSLCQVLKDLPVNFTVFRLAMSPMPLNVLDVCLRQLCHFSAPAGACGFDPEIGRRKQKGIARLDDSLFVWHSEHHKHLLLKVRPFEFIYP